MSDCFGPQINSLTETVKSFFTAESTGNEDGLYELRESQIMQGKESADEYEIDLSKVDLVQLRDVEDESDCCVLVACGSFNPITNAHIKMMESAKSHMIKRENMKVAAGFMSPVNDGYKKPGLASATHRLHMVKEALRESNWITLDDWEARQDGAQRTYHVLSHLEESLANNLDDIPEIPKIFLVCGADLIESMLIPGHWKESTLEQLFAEFGIVCLERPGSNIASAIAESDILCDYEEDIIIVKNHRLTDISSTMVRKRLKENEDFSDLVPPAVVEYLMNNRNLYDQGSDVGTSTVALHEE